MANPADPQVVHAVDSQPISGTEFDAIKARFVSMLHEVGVPKNVVDIFETQVLPGIELKFDPTSSSSRFVNVGKVQQGFPSGEYHLELGGSNQTEVMAGQVPKDVNLAGLGRDWVVSHELGHGVQAAYEIANAQETTGYSHDGKSYPKPSQVFLDNNPSAALHEDSSIAYHIENERQAEGFAQSYVKRELASAGMNEDQVQSALNTYYDARKQRNLTDGLSITDHGAAQSGTSKAHQFGYANPYDEGTLAQRMGGSGAGTAVDAATTKVNDMVYEGRQTINKLTQANTFKNPATKEYGPMSTELNGYLNDQLDRMGRVQRSLSVGQIDPAQAEKIVGDIHAQIATSSTSMSQNLNSIKETSWKMGVAQGEELTNLSNDLDARVSQLNALAAGEKQRALEAYQRTGFDDSIAVTDKAAVGFSDRPRMANGMTLVGRNDLNVRPPEDVRYAMPTSYDVETGTASPIPRDAPRIAPGVAATTPANGTALGEEPENAAKAASTEAKKLPEGSKPIFTAPDEFAGKWAGGSLQAEKLPLTAAQKAVAKATSNEANSGFNRMSQVAKEIQAEAKAVKSTGSSGVTGGEAVDEGVNGRAAVESATETKATKKVWKWNKPDKASGYSWDWAGQEASTKPAGNGLINKIFSKTPQPLKVDPNSIAWNESGRWAGGPLQAEKLPPTEAQKALAQTASNKATSGAAKKVTKVTPVDDWGFGTWEDAPTKGSLTKVAASNVGGVHAPSLASNDPHAVNGKPAGAAKATSGFNTMSQVAKEIQHEAKAGPTSDPKGLSAGGAKAGGSFLPAENITKTSSRATILDPVSGKPVNAIEVVRDVSSGGTASQIAASGKSAGVLKFADGLESFGNKAFMGAMGASAAKQMGEGNYAGAAVNVGIAGGAQAAPTVLKKVGTKVVAKTGIDSLASRGISNLLETRAGSVLGGVAEKVASNAALKVVTKVGLKSIPLVGTAVSLGVDASDAGGAGVTTFGNVPVHWGDTVGSAPGKKNETTYQADMKKALTASYGPGWTQSGGSWKQPLYDASGKVTGHTIVELKNGEFKQSQEGTGALSQQLAAHPQSFMPPDPVSALKASAPVNLNEWVHVGKENGQDVYKSSILKDAKTITVNSKGEATLSGGGSAAGHGVSVTGLQGAAPEQPLVHLKTDKQVSATVGAWTNLAKTLSKPTLTMNKDPLGNNLGAHGKVAIVGGGNLEFYDGAGKLVSTYDGKNKKTTLASVVTSDIPPPPPHAYVIKSGPVDHNTSNIVKTITGSDGATLRIFADGYSTLSKDGKMVSNTKLSQSEVDQTIWSGAPSQEITTRLATSHNVVDSGSSARVDIPNKISGEISTSKPAGGINRTAGFGSDGQDMNLGANKGSKLSYVANDPLSAQKFEHGMGQAGPLSSMSATSVANLDSTGSSFFDSNASADHGEEKPAGNGIAVEKPLDQVASHGYAGQTTQTYSYTDVKGNDNTLSFRPNGVVVQTKADGTSFTVWNPANNGGAHWTGFATHGISDPYSGETLTGNSSMATDTQASKNTTDLPAYLEASNGGDSGSSQDQTPPTQPADIVSENSDGGGNSDQTPQVSSTDNTWAAAAADYSQGNDSGDASAPTLPTVEASPNVFQTIKNTFNEPKPQITLPGHTAETNPPGGFAGLNTADYLKHHNI